MLAKDSSGYMTHYGSMALKDLVAKAKAQGLKVGVYDNPLWIHGPRETPVDGTDYNFGSLYWNGSTEVMNPKAEDMWFHWVVADQPGTRVYRRLLQALFRTGHRLYPHGLPLVV